MRHLRRAWRVAAWVFLLSRLLFITITFVCIFLLSQFIPLFAQRLEFAAGYQHHSYLHNILFFSWLRWDAKAFLNISYFGYKSTPDVSFFPFWPLVQHVGGFLLGGSFPGSFYISGLLLANICYYLALVFCYCLLAEDFDPALAKRALFCLSFSPFALFFFAGYSESLFILLCFAFFLLLRRGKALDWWLAGVVGFFAALTRSSGIVLVVPFLVMYVQHFWVPEKRGDYSSFQKFRALAPIALIPAAILAYMLYLSLTKGDPFIFRTQEGAIWNRQFTPPWITLLMAVQAVFQSPSPLFLLLNTADVIVIGLSLLILALGWRHLPWHYRLFALGLAMFVLSFPTHTVEPLMSQPRYMLSVFPITVISAFWSKNPTFYKTFIILALIYLVINTVLFINNIWIA